MADHPEPLPCPPADRPAASPAPPVPPAPAAWHARLYRRHTPLGWVGHILAGILLGIFLIWAILFVTKGRFLKGAFERVATRTAHRPVQVGGDFQLYFNPINVKFYAEGLRVANPGWIGKGDFFAARRIDSRFALVPLLFSGTRRINRLAIEGGRLDLRWDKAHRRNSWTFEGDGRPLELPHIRAAMVDDTRLAYDDPALRLHADIRIATVKARDTRFASAIRFTGSGLARGTPFGMNGALLAPNATVSGGENRLLLHLDGVHSIADVAGTLPGATELEGSRLKVTVSGRNLAELFAVAGVAVPQTRRYRLSAALTKAGDEWRFTGLRGRFGDSDLAGKLTVKMRQPRLKLTATLATRTLDIVDIAPFIGYNPDLVAAKGGAATVTTVGGTPRLLPDAPLRIESLRNFDAALRYTVRRVRAKSFPVSNIALALTLDDRLLTLSPLTFEMARGHVASDISIDARDPRVVTDYDIRISPTPMGVLLAGFGVEESGTTGTLKARIKLHGVGDSVRKSLATADGRIAVIMPRGSFWTRNVQLAELDIGTYAYRLFQGKLKKPVQINCGLVGFTVRNGIAAADPILIDTEKNVMLGRGGFSFRNEAIDLAFRADGKKFSLFSGQSPVAINGYFARPGINPISSDLIARAGAGLGLSLLATPLAGVLAFVDIGDAKSAACGPVLAGAGARAQRTASGKPRDDVGNGTTAKSENGSRSNAQRKAQRKKFLGIF